VTTAALAEELLETLGLLRRQTRRTIGRPWPVQAVSGAQVDLIRVVRRQPGISVAAAATELGLAANTVSTLVGSLVAEGLVQRVRAPADRRIAQLHLSESAQRTVDQWRDQRSAAVAAALGRLAAADRRTLAEALPVLGRLATELRPEDR
jgi:DNA-binding MarR family transcriptional regulator